MPLLDITNFEPVYPFGKENDLLRQIETCDDTHALSEIVRSTSNLFDRPAAVKVFCRRLNTLKPKMRNRDISGLLNKLSKVNLSTTKSKRIRQKLMVDLSDLAIDKMHCLSARDISLVLNALARRNIRNDKLFQKAGEVALSRANEFNPRDISATVNAFAKMKYQQTEFFEAIAEVAIALIKSFDAQGLSNMVSAFTKAEHCHPVLFERVATMAVSIISTFTAQNLCNILDAFTRLGHCNTGLFEAITSAAVSIIHTFKARDFTSMTKDYARLDYYDPNLFDLISQAVIPIIHTFEAYHLSNLVAAFARFGHHYPILFEEIACASILIVDTFNAKGLEIMVNAYAKVDHHHPVLFDEAATAAISSMKSFDVGNLSIFASAYAKMRHNHPALFEEIASHSVCLANNFHAPELFCLLDAFEKMDYRPAKVLPLKRDAASAVLKSDITGLSSMAHLFARTESANDFAEKAADRIMGNVSQLDNKVLIEVTKIFVTVRYAHRGLWTSLATEVTRRDDSLWSAQDLGKLAAAFGIFDIPLSARVIGMTFRNFQNKRIPEINAQDVACISSAIPCGHRLKVIPQGFVEAMTTLAIDKSAESRHDDVRCILLNFSKFYLTLPMRGKLLAIYWPIFNELSIFMSESDRDEISRIYADFDASHDDESWVTVFCHGCFIK
jgi:hypothetical protein